MLFVSVTRRPVPTVLAAVELFDARGGARFVDREERLLAPDMTLVLLSALDVALITSVRVILRWPRGAGVSCDAPLLALESD